MQANDPVALGSLEVVFRRGRAREWYSHSQVFAVTLCAECRRKKIDALFG